MGLHPDYRSQGIGRRLLNAVIDSCWAYGYTRIELEVFSDNIIAAHMYRQAGFHLEGLKKFAYFLDGKYRDLIMMALLRQE